MEVEEHSVWWAVARSEELGSKKPIGISCAGHAVALWREPDGTARAVEDRCPHRRVPLSLGCILPDGRLRCGYHGWTFAGATGRLEEIPNLPGETRFPAVYRVRTYPVQERDGLVRINLAATGTIAPIPKETATDLPLSGSTAVAIGHDQYIRAFLDAPELVISIPGVQFTTYLSADPHVEDEHVVMERSCRRHGLRWPARVSADFELNLRTETHIETGETALRLMDRDFRPLLSGVIAPVPAVRNTTAVRWRAQAHAKGRLRRRPFLVHDTIDATRLAAVLPSASIEFDKARLGERAPWQLAV